MGITAIQNWCAALLFCQLNYAKPIWNFSSRRSFDAAPQRRMFSAQTSIGDKEKGPYR
jgi:hypothetical protein